MEAMTIFGNVRPSWAYGLNYRIRKICPPDPRQPWTQAVL